MNQNISIKYLVQKKDNISLKIKFISYIINNHELALDRIKEAKEFVKNENEKIKNNPQNSSELIANLYVYMPLYIGYYGYNDFVNFPPAKAPIIVEDDEKRNMLLGNYNFAIESWDKAEQKIMNSKTFLNDYMSLLDDQLKIIEEKITALLYNEEEVDNTESTKNKKRLKNNYSTIANMYVKSCKELKIYSPTADQLIQTNAEGPSRTDWYRKLKNPTVLITISNILEKKLNNKKLKKTDINFWLNVKENLNILIENVSSQLAKNREIPIEDKLDYYESKIGIMSQVPENPDTNWDEV